MKPIDLQNDILRVVSDDELIEVGDFIEEHKDLKRKPTQRPPKLEQLYQIATELELQDLENIDIVGLRALRWELGSIPDTRNESYVHYKLGDILIIVLLAVMSGSNSWFDIEVFGAAHEPWLKQFLNLENGVPTDDTYRLAVMGTDMKSVYHIVVGFLMRKISKAIETSGKPALEKPDIIPIDGKVSRSSARRQTSHQEAAKPVNMLNAYSSNWGMCLDQEYIEKKSNEIPAAPILLNRMDLNGAVVTADALNTQTKTAEAITAQGGKYVLAVKGSRKYLYQGIVEYFDPKRRIKIKENPRIGESYHRTIEKEHDSLVIREYYLTTDISNVYKREEWPELTEIGLVRRTVINLQYNGQIHEEFRYYICGGTIDIEDFTRSTRLHWGVENNLHWQLDYIFKDDANRTMADTGAEGLQLFKKASMAILKASKVLYPHYYSMNNIRSLLNQNFEGNIGKILSILTIDNILEANMKRR